MNGSSPPLVLSHPQAPPLPTPNHHWLSCKQKNLKIATPRSPARLRLGFRKSMGVTHVIKKNNSRETVLRKCGGCEGNIFSEVLCFFSTQIEILWEGCNLVFTRKSLRM